jgi:NAD-dependent SIR2 family protein deacetylase
MMSSPATKKRKVEPRQVVKREWTLREVADLIQKSKRIVVLAGAGISVSSGVPDFRSANGIYKMVEDLECCESLPDPQCIFDIEYFLDDPKPFYEVARKILFSSTGASPLPSKAHAFIASLEREKRLLRVYTQNIDGLEFAAGVSKNSLRYCHGSMERARCVSKSCKSKKLTRSQLEAALKVEDIPSCARCGGTIKPDITFFGEKLVDNIGKTLTGDKQKVDLLIVMGTSLQVSPMDTILQYFPSDVPQILINKTHVQPRKTVSEGFDIELLGNADAIVEAVEQLISGKGTFEAKDAQLGHQFAPNIFLFEGADENSVRDSMNKHGGGDVYVYPPPAITCDGCGKGIDNMEGGLMCNTCFGLDTCSLCSSFRSKHLNTHPTHKFVLIKEEVGV